MSRLLIITFNIEHLMHHTLSGFIHRVEGNTYNAVSPVVLSLLY